MDITLYNTLTKQKELFKPIQENNVRMYVCGPTVYDYAHIGNARPVIVFDTLYRLLRHVYGASNVTYARNITDVDDKINARAAKEGVEIRELTERTNAQFQKDITALHCLAPNVQPRATEHIGQMQDLISLLIEKNFAYAAEGHVLFHVPAMARYGKLSNRSVDECKPALGSKWPLIRKTQWISSFGNLLQMMSLAGHHHGARLEKEDALVGT